MNKDLSLFNRFWNDVPSTFGAGRIGFPDMTPREFEGILNGRCDLEELDDRYEIELEVPGVKKSEIGIEMTGDRLIITWNRERRKQKKSGRGSRFERSEGRFQRTFNLEGVERDNIRAELHSGVLKVTAPKESSARAKRIEIQ